MYSQTSPAGQVTVEQSAVVPGLVPVVGWRGGWLGWNTLSEDTVSVLNVFADFSSRAGHSCAVSSCSRVGSSGWRGGWLGWNTLSEYTVSVLNVFADFSSRAGHC
eukprot:TRINITY_DN2188_c0_g1_i1.p1 TRINITY_DN2188_c0_g1~~TRINITY_DN2188_c0_g1_i1.p1  ORF type:complete len:105 (-),score=16.74 TRINITY_DN2188_c0_g1_i1:24-338(-)